MRWGAWGRQGGCQSLGYRDGVGGSEVQHPGSIRGPSGVGGGGEQPLRGTQECCPPGGLWDEEWGGWERAPKPHWEGGTAVLPACPTDAKQSREL